jgi:hypothetical protein
MKTFTSMFVEQLRQAVTIAEKIEALETQLRGILTNVATSEKKVTVPPTAVKPSTPAAPAKKASKTISPEHRAKIAAAVKARWAKVKGKPAAPVAKASSKKKGGLTPEGRAKLAASMKARWAARKKGALAANAPAK